MTFCFLHGFLGAPSSFDAVRDHLSPRHHVMSLPLPGHGLAPAPVADWAATIEGLERAITQEDVTRAHLVGYSMGGRVALAWAAAHPGRFRRVSLIGTNPPLEDERARRARRDADEALADRLRAQEGDGLARFVDEWEALPLFATQRALAPAVLEAQRRTRTAHRAAPIADALARLGLGTMAPIDISRLEPRPRFLVGGEDRALLERLRALGVRSTVVDGAGHNVVLERPARVAAWLEEEDEPC